MAARVGFSPVVFFLFRHDVVNGTGILNAKFASHAATARVKEGWSPSIVKMHGTDPFSTPFRAFSRRVSCHPFPGGRGGRAEGDLISTRNVEEPNLFERANLCEPGRGAKQALGN